MIEFLYYYLQIAQPKFELEFSSCYVETSVVRKTTVFHILTLTACLPDVLTPWLKINVSASLCGCVWLCVVAYVQDCNGMCDSRPDDQMHPAHFLVPPGCGLAVLQFKDA